MVALFIFPQRKSQKVLLSVSYLIEKSISLLDSLKGKEKESILPRMVRLRLRFNISENVTDEMKDEFNNLTNEMSKVNHIHPSALQDEDSEWLSENEYFKN